MFENEAVDHFTYRDLIKKAYIEPIRTVLVVDDEFPTLDRLIDFQYNFVNNEGPEVVIPKKENAEKVKTILKFCREDERKWMVDVHDGNNVDDTSVKYLHQSDLLILDYQLEGDDGDGSKAIKIIQHLAKTDHFNLIIVYTKQKDMLDVFNCILLGLFSTWGKIKDFNRERVQQLLDHLDDADEGIYQKLKDCFNQINYLKCRDKDVPNPYNYKDNPDVNIFIEICNSITKNGKDVIDLFKKFLCDFEERNIGQLSTENLDKPFYHFEENLNWIKTNRIFITVVSKQSGADSLVETLADALLQWKPNPNRLISAKMRAELESIGMNADDASLTNDLIQAKWFDDLLNSDQDSKPIKLSSLITKQWEGLIGGVRNNIQGFSKILLKCVEDGDKSEKVKEFFEVDLNNEDVEVQSLIELNTYNCSKDPEGWHLTTGHVIKIDTEYWVCLTPACDLVPGQKQSAKYRNLAPSIPFKAVRILPFGGCKTQQRNALLKADSNLCVFLNIENTHRIFQFTDLELPFANPVWEEMYAYNQGKFEGDFEFSVARLKWNSENEAPVGTKYTAKVVSQLRYEYALNLLQRLGGSLMRIGLDFVSLKKE